MNKKKPLDQIRNHRVNDSWLDVTTKSLNSIVRGTAKLSKSHISERTEGKPLPLTGLGGHGRPIISSGVQEGSAVQPGKNRLRSRRYCVVPRARSFTPKFLTISRGGPPHPPRHHEGQKQHLDGSLDHAGDSTQEREG